MLSSIVTFSGNSNVAQAWRLEGQQVFADDLSTLAYTYIYIYISKVDFKLYSTYVFILVLFLCWNLIKI